MPSPLLPAPPPSHHHRRRHIRALHARQTPPTPTPPPPSPTTAESISPEIALENNPEIQPPETAPAPASDSSSSTESSGPTTSSGGPGPGPTSGAACFTTGSLTTTTCPPATSGIFSPCSQTVIQTSACSPGLLCTTATSKAGGANSDVSSVMCMRRQDAPQPIITAVFAAIVVLGLAAFIFSCCRDSFRRRARSKQQQVILDAKSNNMTNKSARRPLMHVDDDDDNNPFQDRHHLHGPR
ncbi:hypothetical protein L249_8634 [Ophiocordyceps polyrhachis-furcata BCC 54312]|uniref:Uncharacterized protein n=1 Tax=Ophiocordyceps polyrhachis-furcata BCC 54312 TaxID=1330021 RepID=A0A367L721_9HYPO|nr:hypothetical protein L249_8634 [Ophiocordyceps polyrhachis-furcata BCC 54312]